MVVVRACVIMVMMMGRLSRRAVLGQSRPISSAVEWRDASIRRNIGAFILWLVMMVVVTANS
jgi:hypothetical protein